jgi:PHP family Zn ribbon phosphoesterase
MMRLLADMHVHTVLSPCASREMSPPAIVREALRRGLAMIAVCDHNTAGNARAVAEAAATAAAKAAACRAADRALPLAVIAGMEITTAEEAHVLGLFPDAETAERAAAEVRAGLPLWRPLLSNGPSAALRSPEQELVDAAGNLVGIEEKMLSAASRFTLSETVALIHGYGGLAIAAHVDRRSFSVVSQLGFLPPEVPFDALEISAAGAALGRAEGFLSHGLPLVSSSDSHFLDDLGVSRTALAVEAPSFAELALALAGAGGRGCAIA